LPVKVGTHLPHTQTALNHTTVIKEKIEDDAAANCNEHDDTMAKHEHVYIYIGIMDGSCHHG
uniref:Uncharacterized protein n=1 Tax=Oryza brachyantha TaxID=4533 RepID=J3M5A7_ORYBR